MCRLINPAAESSAAFDDCYGDKVHKAMDLRVAERVLMARLSSGDLVLASPSEATRVIVNQHTTESKTWPMLDITHSVGTLSLTADHVLLVDGAFVPAASARAGSVLSSGATIESVGASTGGIISPLTASGTILAAGPTGAPVIASVFGEWAATYMLGRSTASLSRGLAYIFPANAQQYYDGMIEPLLTAAMPVLKNIVTMPSPLVDLFVLLLDAALAAGFVVYSAASLSGLLVALVVVALTFRSRKA